MQITLKNLLPMLAMGCALISVPVRAVENPAEQKAVLASFQAFLDGLGKRDATPVPVQDYQRMRAQTLAEAKLA